MAIVGYIEKILKQNYDEDAVAEFMKAASIYNSYYHGINHQTTLRVENKERVLGWHTFDQPIVLGPLPFSMQSPAANNLDPYTLDCDAIGYAGGIFVGLEDDIDVPVLDTTDNDTVLNELLATVFVSCLVEDPNMAYVYLQILFKFLSLYVPNVLPRFVKRKPLEATPYEL